ncbi:MAG: helix-turn-helix domain-containing protein [Ruminococcus sp.]
MKNTDETPELSYHLIQQAVCGESKAVEKILHIYDKYINSVVMFETTDMNGNAIKTIDEDMKIQIQMKLIESIQTKWRNLFI